MLALQQSAEGESDAARLDTQTRFVRALGQGMDWILQREAAEYRDFLAQTFPRFAPDALVALTDTYRRIGMWTTPRIDEAAYMRADLSSAKSGMWSTPARLPELVQH